MPKEDPRIVELYKMREKTYKAGGEERIAKHKSKGKLTARERIDLLLDPGTYTELEPYITHQGDEMGINAEKAPGDGVVTGFGQIDGRTVYVFAQDFTVQGGSLGEMHARKICRVMDLAVKSGAPVIGMLDSGGARIQEGVRSLGGYAEVFKRNALTSGIVPQISLMFGPCAGGATYSPALTDMIIMVEKQSYMFITGPEVIKSVTGEVIDFEGLGGADVHTATSGVAHLTGKSDQEVIGICRKIMGYLPSNNIDNPPFIAPAANSIKKIEALNSIVPLDPAAPYSMHEIIELVTDTGSFIELQPNFARNAIVGLARLGGFSVGIVASEPSVMAGCIDINASDKIARFVRFADSFNLPLISFVDTPGFLPGINQEHGGVIRHGAKILFAFAEASVPKVSVVTRKAYGGAYIVMGSKFLGGDVNYGWPSAEIAVMGPEGAVNILYRKQIDGATDAAKERAKRVQDYRDQFLNPYAAASHGYLDDVIEPSETRIKVIAALNALKDKATPALQRKHGNIPL